MTNSGISFEKDDWDDHLEPAVAEHLGELWLMQKLRQHPWRTWNVKEASVHIVGVPAFVSLAAAELESYPCGNMKDHESRMEGVLEGVKKLKAFKEHPRRFLLASTHFRLTEIFGKNLLDLFQDNGATIATGDRFYGGNSNEGWNRHMDASKIVIPYKAHYLVDALGRNSATLNYKRNNGFFFRGCENRSRAAHGGKALRKVVIELGEKLKSADTKSVCMAGRHRAEHSGIKNVAAVAFQTAKGYSGSRFCFVPEGDSPTSRRLFDALAAGCVPVHMGTFDTIVQNLPFPRSIDWPSIVLFAGDLECTDNNLMDVVAWLRRRDNDMLWKKMNEKGHMFFKEYLSYVRGDGFVKAMLREMPKGA